MQYPVSQGPVVYTGDVLIIKFVSSSMEPLCHLQVCQGHNTILDVKVNTVTWSNTEVANSGSLPSAAVHTHKASYDLTGGIISFDSNIITENNRQM